MEKGGDGRRGGDGGGREGTGDGGEVVGEIEKEMKE